MRPVQSVFLGLLLATTGGHAIAQTPAQTPENAHNFLRGLAQQGVIYYQPGDSTKSFSTPVSDRPNRRNSHTIPMGPWLLRLPASDRCLTRVEPIDLPPYEGRDASGFPEHNNYVMGLAELFQQGIDWSKVNTIAQSGSEVSVQSNYLSRGPVRLIFGSADMAARAAYAMEVIKMSCDPVANTGF